MLKRLMKEARMRAYQDSIEYWCDIAAMHATEASFLFGHGKHEDGRTELMKSVTASTMARNTARKMNGDEK